MRCKGVVISSADSDTHLASGDAWVTGRCLWSAHVGASSTIVRRTGRPCSGTSTGLGVGVGIGGEIVDNVAKCREYDTFLLGAEK
jgi:hypothetical protein